MVILHCSSLPRVLKCPGSVVRDGDETAESQSSEASLGTAFHEGVRWRLFGQGSEETSEEVASRHDADPEELEELLVAAERGWPDIRDAFKGDILTELHFTEKIAPDITLDGTMDVYAQEGASAKAAYADWKTGWKERPYWPQMLGYALLGYLKWGVREADCFIVYPREGYADRRQFRSAALDAFKNQLIATLASDQRRAGRHCDDLFCPKFGICETYRAYHRKTAVVLTGDEGALATRSQRAAFYGRLQAIERAAKNFRTRFHEDLKRGRITADGRCYGLKSKRQKKINVLAASEAASRFLPESVIASCGSLSITKLEKAIRADAERETGKKETGIAAVTAFREALEAYGAVTTRPASPSIAYEEVDA